MPYEINVSKNGEHLFATNSRSINDKQDALELWDLFESKFPPSEGYSSTLYEVHESSTVMKECYPGKEIR